MMIGNHFYNKTVRRATAVFGTLFNNITIKRKNKEIPVAISHGPREKWLEEARALQKDNEAFDKILPRMSYELATMNYDVNRKISSNHKVIKRPIVLGDDVKRETTYTPVPYSLDFILYVQAKSMNDGWQIIEQIVPFFTPAYTVKVRDAFPVNGHDNRVDMPILLNAVTWSDDWQGAFEDKRIIEWQIDFTLKTNFYGPSAEIAIIYDSRATVVATDNVDDPTATKSVVFYDSDSERDDFDIPAATFAATEVGGATLDSDAVDSDVEASLDSDGDLSDYIDPDGTIYRIARDIDSQDI